MQKTNYELALKFEQVKIGRRIIEGAVFELPFFIFPSLKYQQSLWEKN